MGSRPYWAARKLTGDTLKVVWAEFSTLSLAVFCFMSVIAWYRQAHPHLELKTQPMSCPVDKRTKLVMTTYNSFTYNDIANNTKYG